MKKIGSITSVKPNQKILARTLKSILNYKNDLDFTYINLCEQGLRSDKLSFHNKELDQELNNIIDQNKDFLKLVWCKDLGPYTKLLPTLSKHKNEDCIIITFDDDTIYHPNLISNYISEFNKKPGILTARGFTLDINAGWKNVSYTRRVEPKNNDCVNNFHTGKGTVLYNPLLFKHIEGIFDSDTYMRLCPTNDDTWFNFFRINQGISCRLVHNVPYAVADLTNHNCALQMINCTNASRVNNQQIQNCVKHFNL